MATPASFPVQRIQSSAAPARPRLSVADQVHLCDRGEAGLAALDQLVGTGGKGTVLVRISRGEDGTLEYAVTARNGGGW